MLPNPKVDLSLMIKKTNQTRTPDGRPIPPKWHDVYVATSKDAYHQAVGKDDKGTTVYIRSLVQDKLSKDKKYDRLKSFIEAVPKLMKKVQDSAKKGKEEAKVLDLIYKTGFRVDSGSDTKAKVKAYGASGLLGKHVKVSGSTLKFNFPSKKGGTTKAVLHDSILAKTVKDKEPDQKLFDTNYHDISKYWKGFTTKYPIKDLRLYVGTSLAIKEVKKRPIPTTIKEYKHSVNEVCDAVADKLQNTRAVVKGSYIMPAVFSEWDKAVEGIRSKKMKKNPIKSSLKRTLSKIKKEARPWETKDSVYLGIIIVVGWVVVKWILANQQK